VNYFFLYPAGHLGLTAFTFLVSLPLTQVIDDFLELDTLVATGLAIDSGLLITTTVLESMFDVCCRIFALIVGLEKVKFVA
jgi:hypothetical protein